jgi:hypothetical protein
VEEIFSGCADFTKRPVRIGGDPEKEAVVYAIDGQVRTERLNDYVLRPLALSVRLRSASPAEALEEMVTGEIYARGQVCQSLDEAVFALVEGSALVDFPAAGALIAYAAATEEKRSVSEPEDEPAQKGARDSFVESLRTNTSLVRRRFRAPELKIWETIVGRQSVTPVDVVYLEGLTDPDLVGRVEEAIAALDTDEVLQSAGLEEALPGQVATPFPLAVTTQRPDRFCQGLAEGRVGVLVDGIPLGYLLPGTVGAAFRTGQDRSQNWMTASALALLRYLCMLVSLFLPGGYVAAVKFHPEMLPARLAWTISEAKTDVPFSAVLEVLLLLLAFEIVQEAGLRLPGAIGQTVSILGGLVVGSAAVEARVISPVVLIVVAGAGIAGYTVPNQGFSGALRLWRFLLVLAGSLAGLPGLTGAGAVLVGHLAKLESFGVPYLAPFVGGKDREEGHGILRWPRAWVKVRESSLHPQNQRRQG